MTSDRKPSVGPASVEGSGEPGRRNQPIQEMASAMRHDSHTDTATIDTAGLSCAAPGRVNEDTYTLTQHAQASSHWLCAVADGQGGQRGAAAAAQTGCDHLIRAAANLHPRRLWRPGTWRRLMHRADLAVAAHPEAGFTTLAAAYVGPAGFAGGVSGDSAIVLNCGRRSPRVLTGKPTDRAAVGSGQARFEVASASLDGPWTVLLMSDGVWKFCGWEPIFETLASHPPVDAIVDSLHRLVCPGGIRYPDDFTILALQHPAAD